MRRALRLAALLLPVSMACSDDDQPDTASSTTASLPSSTSSIVLPAGVPGLLRPDVFDGDWRVIDTSDVEAQYCGEPRVSRAGAVGSESTSLLLSNPEENSTAVHHEIVRYHSEAEAGAALEAFRSLPEHCPHSTRQDDDGEVNLSLESDPVEGHPQTAALQLLVEWPDGSGQGARLTATRFGSVVSFLDVDAVQGGVPTDSHVGDILTEVPVA